MIIYDWRLSETSQLRRGENMQFLAVIVVLSERNMPTSQHNKLTEIRWPSTKSPLTCTIL